MLSRTVGRSVWSLAIILELEPQQSTDDRAQIFPLVVEGAEVSRFGIPGQEKEVQDADGLVTLQPLELGHDPALEIRIRGKAYRQELDRPYFLCHREPPSVGRVMTFLPPCSLASGLSYSGDLVSLGVAGAPMADVEQDGEDHPEPVETN